MKIRTLISLGVMLAAVGQMAGQSKTSSQPNKQTRAEKSAAQNAAPANNGERVFMQNCSRCHNAPESFPSSISGTIVRHMRVRANLSERDAQALLRFFNP